METSTTMETSSTNRSTRHRAALVRLAQDLTLISRWIYRHKYLSAFTTLQDVRNRLQLLIEENDGNND